MTKLLMFEVDVKNVTEKGRRGPAQVWGSDTVIILARTLRTIFEN